MPIDVWLFFHAADRDATREHRDHAQRLCVERGWGFQPRSVGSVKSTNGRPLPLLAPDVAAGLYPRVHRSRVATLVIGRDPLIPLHPRINEAARARRHVTLRRYVAYKCFWARLPQESATNESWLGSFIGWCNAIDCEGENDPRCLPFHIFDGDARDLEQPASRTRFDGRYGTGPFRTDGQGAEWRMQPAIFHGSAELSVAGCLLRRGCHWDVTAVEHRIATPAGIWLVDGHVNVYPDAHIRGHKPSVRQLI